MNLNSEMVTTIHGPMEARLLDKRVTVEEDSKLRKTVATEYLFDGRVVHRSVNIEIRQGLGIEAMLGNLR